MRYRDKTKSRAAAVSRSFDPVIPSGQPEVKSMVELPSWSSIARLLNGRQPRPPPTRKQAAKLVDALARPSSDNHEHCLSSASWGPEMVWSSAAAESAISTITTRFERVIARDKSAALSRPLARPPKTAPEAGPGALDATIEATNPYPQPTRPLSAAPPTASAGSHRPGQRKGTHAQPQPTGLEEFQPHSPIAHEAKEALDSMARIGDRPYRTRPRPRSRPSTANANTSAPSSSSPKSHRRPATATAERSPGGSPPKGANSLQEVLLKIHTRTAAIKAIENAMLKDAPDAASQSHDPLGLSSMHQGLATVLAAGASGLGSDPDAILCKLLRPPALLNPSSATGSTGPIQVRQEYVMPTDQCHSCPISDTFDWGQSDLLVCALDGEIDAVPLELSLLLRDVGSVQFSGGAIGGAGVDGTVFIRALNLLLQLHNELRCPRANHEIFWAAHAPNRPGNVISVLHRLSRLCAARSAFMALLRALVGRATPADKEAAAAELEAQRLDKMLAAEVEAGATSRVGAECERAIEGRGEASVTDGHHSRGRPRSGSRSGSRPGSRPGTTGSGQRRAAESRPATAASSVTVTEPVAGAGGVGGGGEGEGEGSSAAEVNHSPMQPLAKAKRGQGKGNWAFGQAALVRAGALRAVAFARSKGGVLEVGEGTEAVDAAAVDGAAVVTRRPSSPTRRAVIDKLLEDLATQPKISLSASASVTATVTSSEAGAAKGGEQPQVSPSPDTPSDTARPAKAPANRIGAWGAMRRAVNVMSTIKSLSRASQQTGPSGAEAAATATATASTIVSVSSVESVGASEGSATATEIPASPAPNGSSSSSNSSGSSSGQVLEGPALLQALVDGLVRALPWPLSVVHFAGEELRPSFRT